MNAFLLLLLVAPCTLTLVPTLAAPTWIDRPFSLKGYWAAITSSSDGTKITAVGSENLFYRSTNSWYQNSDIKPPGAGTGDFTVVASSSDGSTIVAANKVPDYGHAAGTIPNVWVSTDSGANFNGTSLNVTDNPNPSHSGHFGGFDPTGITVSSDGTKVAVCFAGAHIWTSADSGASWTMRTSMGRERLWRSIASSSDGATIVASFGRAAFRNIERVNNSVWVSRDSGVSWTDITPTGSIVDWKAITSSSDGMTIAAVESQGGIWTSSDSGNSWANVSVGEQARIWLDITSSSDGTKLFAVEQQGGIWISSDSGNTWTHETVGANVYFTTITSSSDGTKLAAGQGGRGAVWVLVDLCNTNEKVQGNICLRCPPGSSSTDVAGDDPRGGDTSCVSVLCAANEKVRNHTCVSCPSGKSNGANNDASSSDTNCNSILCGRDNKVVNHTCVSCLPGKSSPHGYDASGNDTVCTTVVCGRGRKVVNHACVDCPPGTDNLEFDDATGNDTLCVDPNNSQGNNSPAPGSVASNSPAPGIIDSNSPAPGIIDSDSPAPGIIDSNSPAPGIIDSDSPAPEIIAPDSHVTNEDMGFPMYGIALLLLIPCVIFVAIGMWKHRRDIKSKNVELSVQMA